MSKKTIILALVGTLLSFQLLAIAGASDFFMDCEDFEKEKREDCEYILNDEWLNKEEREAVLLQLYEGSYDYDSDYNFEEYEGLNLTKVTDRLNSIETIETSRLITAWKIFVFGILNYFVLSITKSSVVIKWLGVV